jgi:hypothetical protein
MNRRLSFGDVLAVLQRVPELKSIVLVGGQALNYWAERLGIVDPEAPGPYGPALSDDIDFLGSARDALIFGEATGGAVAIAGMDDHSPNTALVTLDIDGETHLIDFLGSMKGFSAQELERARQWAVPLKLPRATSATLYVMHPVHCLEAQLENVYGRALNRRGDPGGERYTGRIQLAIEACRRIGNRHVDEGDPRSALKIAERIHELSLLPSAMRARFEDDVHVERGIPDASAMPAEFREKRLLQLQEQLERVVRKFARERERSKSGSQAASR